MIRFCDQIEKLEDERLELKRCLRAAARQMGQKFASENDHVDNAMMHIWAGGKFVVYENCRWDFRGPHN